MTEDTGDSHFARSKITTLVGNDFTVVKPFLLLLTSLK